MQFHRFHTSSRVFLQEEKFNPSMTERLFSSVVIGLWENSRQRGYLGGPWAAYF